MTLAKETQDKGRPLSLRPSTARRTIDMLNWTDPGLAYVRKDQEATQRAKDEARQSGLGARYQQDVNSRPSTTIPSVFPHYIHVDTFLHDRQGNREKSTLHQEFLQTEIGQHFQKIAEGLTDNPHLANRTESLFQAVLQLRQLRQERGEDGLQVPDASLIQAWTLQLIGRDNPEEFAKIAELAFADWVTRLSENPIPHIAQANEWIAKRVGENLMQQGKTHGINAVDLGAGTGATMLALAQGLTERKIAFDSIKGVDITPVLVDRAKELFKREGHDDGLSIEVGNATKWLTQQPDESLDAVTMVYAIHHLPYDQQRQLEKLIYRKLQPGGMLAIADPTGRSKFNLENLDIKEPEATAACFRPYIFEVIEELREVGFTTAYKGIPQKDTAKTINGTTVISTEQGDTLDQATLGYALVATKPMKPF